MATRQEKQTKIPSVASLPTKPEIASRKENAAETRRYLDQGDQLASQCPSNRNVPESEADSAYEEKSSSRSASNMHSPSGGQKRGLEPNERRFPQRRNSGNSLHLVTPTALNQVQETGAAIYPHKLTGQETIKPPSVANNYSLSFISDVSDLPSATSIHGQHDLILREAKSNVLFSETPLWVASSQYLESTHNRDRERGSGSPRKQKEKQPRFDLHLASESSSSEVDASNFVLLPCSSYKEE